MKQALSDDQRRELIEMAEERLGGLVFAELTVEHIELSLDDDIEHVMLEVTVGAWMPGQRELLEEHTVELPIPLDSVQWLVEQRAALDEAKQQVAEHGGKPPKPR